MDNQVENGLPELHQLLLALAEVQEEIDRGPRLVKVRQQAVAQKQTELEAQRQKHKSLRVTADQKALQLKSSESKIGDLRGKLNQAASNREFDIIKGQIEADTMANSVLEDEILDSLEQVDAAQAAIKRLEEELTRAKAEETKTIAETAAALPGFEARKTDLSGKIAAAETKLPEEIQIPYRRLVQAHGAGALSHLDGDVCTSCYVKLPPQSAVQVRTGKILFCKTCGRLLYRAPEA